MRQILFIYFAFISLFAFAQVPTVDPTATYYMINDEGEEETDVPFAFAGGQTAADHRRRYRTEPLVYASATSLNIEC